MSNKKDEDNEDDIDYFRDTPVRYLGYSNEVGEAFRQFVSKSAVRLSYAVATFYCLSDASSKAYHVKKDTELYHENGHQYANRKAAEIFIEAALWQGLASVTIPGFTINRICWASGILLNRFAGKAISSASQKVLVTTLGLVSIPVIIKPIDSLVDKLMEEGVELSTRLGFKHQIPHVNSEEFHVTLDKESHHHHTKEEKLTKEN